MSMDKKTTLFSPARILVPDFVEDAQAMSCWSVIACDQHTSEPEYWENCVNFIGGAPSAYDYILPEAYLGTELETEHNEEIRKAMQRFEDFPTREIQGMIFLERTLPDGEIRCGLIGQLDLERYDYMPESVSPIRATEQTVLTRIPPRRRIRASAPIELPHIMILIDEESIFDYLKQNRESFEILYDFDLMAGGGHVKGYAIEGEALERFLPVIAAYESQPEMIRYANLIRYAIGDGNHSLAAAKAHWENVKAETKDLNHPARYALCEVNSLWEESLAFHPIHRLLMNCDVEDVLEQLKNVAEVFDLGENPSDSTKIRILTKKGTCHCCFVNPSHPLTVGTLQNFIEAYLETHPEAKCDYIHGEETLIELTRNENCIGFMTETIAKRELFPYVQKYGTLPKKTFSMGEADSKRFYLEMRRIMKKENP